MPAARYQGYLQHLADYPPDCLLLRENIRVTVELTRLIASFMQSFNKKNKRPIPPAEKISPYLRPSKLDKEEIKELQKRRRRARMEAVRAAAVRK